MERVGVEPTTHGLEAAALSIELPSQNSEDLRLFHVKIT